MRNALVRGLILAVTLLCVGAQSEEIPSALVARLECPDRVNAVAFSSDGKLLAGGYGWRSEGGVRVWNVANRTVALEWVSPTHGDDAQVIRHLAFSPDIKLLAAITWNGDLLLWQLDYWGPPKRTAGIAGSTNGLGSPTGIAFNPASDLLTLSSDKGVVLYDLKSENVRQVFSAASPIDRPMTAGFLADGKTLVFCKRGSVEFWNLAEGKSVKTLSASGFGFFCTLSPRSGYVVAGGGAICCEKVVEIWDRVDGRRVARLTEFRDGLFAAAISNSESFVALGGGDYGNGGHLSLWNIDPVRELGSVSIGKFPLKSLAFSPDDSMLAAASSDGEVLLFSVNQIKGPQIAKQNRPQCGEIAVEKDHVFLVPITTVPTSLKFDYAWKLEIVDPGELSRLAGQPVVLQEWEMETTAGKERARVQVSHPLLAGAKGPALSSYAVFGSVQNPGWTKSTTIKVYGDGSFVASDNAGTCLAYGVLNKSTDFKDVQSLRKSLLGDGLLSIKKEPLTRGLDHFRTRFIGITVDGSLELRSDGELIDSTYLQRRPTQKEQDFDRVFEHQGPLMNSLLNAGTVLPKTTN